MKKYLFLIACMLNAMLASAQYSGSGNGTESDPYLIYNETQLYQMQNFLGSDHAGVVFKLMKDLDLTDFISENFPSEGWTPVGVSSSPFKGKFYGNNHSISGLIISKSINNVGFFGYIDGATISNLTINGTSVKGGNYTGVLCGYALNSTISNCSVELSSTLTASSYSGGFVGYVSSSTISNSSCKASYTYTSASSCGGFNGKALSTTFTGCSSTGNITTGSNRIGGFCGDMQSTTIKNSTSTGNVTGRSYTGGFIGYAASTCSLSNCKSVGDIKGSSYVSGFTGYLSSGSSVSFSSCHSKCKVTNTGDYTGGVVGLSEGACIASMTNCSHFGDISGNNYVGGLIGKIVKIEPTQPTLHRYTLSGSSSSEYYSRSSSYPYRTVTESISNNGEMSTKSIKNCTAIGNISGKTYIGGLIGEDMPSYAYHGTTCTLSNSGSSYYWYLWKDGSYTGQYGYDQTATYYTYTRDYSALSITDSYYSGTLSGTEYVGGIVGHKSAGDIKNCYAYSSGITGSKNVGGIAGYIEGESTTSNVTLKSNVAINTTVSATESNIGRIYGAASISYVTIGALASSEGNKALTTTQVIKQGVVQTVTDDLQNGNVMGKSLLKLKANYVAMGWDFDNNWDILETECYPYKKYQAAPPVIESKLVSQSTTISGSSTNGGTVYLYYKDRDAVSTKCDGNAWSFTTEALQSGANVQLYADVDGMTPSYLTSATVGYPGSGTEADPYRIYTAEDLQGASNKGYYKLMNDIDLTTWINANSPTTGWVAIGRNSGEATYINGDGHKITGLWINTTQDYTGLFSNFSAGVIKNLNVEVASGKSVKGGDYTGILIGRNANGQLLNCSVKGDVQGTTHVGGVTGHSNKNTINAITYEGKVTSSTEGAYVGGFAGLSESDAITAVHAYPIISATGASSYVGGAIGYMNGGTITKSQAENTLTATGANDYVGGLVGYSKGAITLSYSTGTVIASGDNSYTGGLVGYAYNSIANCYSTAKTTGTLYTAGLCAYTFSTINKCYAKGDVYGVRYGGGVVAQLDGSAASLANSIAANNKLELTDQSAWGSRVIGGFKNGAAEPNTSNYALSTMQVSLNGVAQKKSDDAVEGIAKPAVELMKSQTYIDLGWDYSSVWGIDEGSIYPYLLWEVDVNPVTEITLDKTSVIIASGNTETITASIMPLGATNKRLEWTTGNSAIATVKDGVVTAVGIGSTTITATATDGSKVSATCTVQVVANHAEAIAELQTLVDKAQALYDNSKEGDNIGQYQSGARAALLSVIKSVKAKINSTMDDATITSCTTQINEAVTAFNSKKVTAGEDTDISAYDNVVYIEGAEGNVGSTVDLSLNMNNTVSVAGFQCDVYAPEGTTVAKDEDDFYLIDLSTARTTAKKTDYFNSALQADGSVRILCSSTKSYTFSGNEGEVATISLKLGDTMTDGDYPLILKNIVITDNAGKAYKVDYVKTTLKVSSYTLGDANGDGDINVSDFTCIANHIMGSTPASFVAKAADVNQDSEINVSDLTCVANLVLYGSITPSAGAKGMNPASVVNAVSLSDVETSAGKTAEISIAVENGMTMTGFQFDMEMPQGMSLTTDDVTLSTARTNAYNTDFFTSAMMNDGTVRVLCNSSKSATFEGNSGEVVKAKVAVNDNVASGDYVVTLKNIVLSDAAGNAYKVSDAKAVISVGDVTGVGTVMDSAESMKDAKIFSASGMQQASLKNGINIIKYKDGSTKAIIRK